jgi:sugar/nucleoside kinase (ribokinase family)
VQRADVILPSIGEARMFTGAASDEQGCRRWADEGKLVVLKQGAAGCTLFSDDTIASVPAYPVEEIDPTGAGDSFCAGITVGLLEELPLQDLGRFANAVGALAVTVKGPMEGAPTRAQVLSLMAQQA